MVWTTGCDGSGSGGGGTGLAPLSPGLAFVGRELSRKCIYSGSHHSSLVANQITFLPFFYPPFL